MRYITSLNLRISPRPARVSQVTDVLAVSAYIYAFLLSDILINAGYLALAGKFYGRPTLGSCYKGSADPVQTIALSHFSY